jgi:hypothetical protein
MNDIGRIVPGSSGVGLRRCYLGPGAGPVHVVPLAFIHLFLAPRAVNVRAEHCTHNMWILSEDIYTVRRTGHTKKVLDKGDTKNCLNRNVKKKCGYRQEDVTGVVQTR